MSQSSLNFPNLPANLKQDSKDWLISAIDPFHDFEHPIEGAPDCVVSKSFTRKYVQTLTVGAAADDDNITINFYGFHGATMNRFSAWGVDYAPDPASATSATLSPVSILKRNGTNWPNITSLISGTSTKLGGFNTAQVDDVPSRLVSFGLEVNDVTPALYRRGMLHANHCTGEAMKMNVGRNDATAVTPLWTQAVMVRKPILPISASQVVSTPGAYIGPTSKGVYIAARLNEIRKPSLGRVYYTGGNTSGAHQFLPVLSEPNGATGDVATILYPCLSDVSYGVTREEIEAASGWRDSGFMPFVIGLSGLAAQTVLQVTMATTVEYFPQVTHPFECGLATYSPTYDPEAFRLYHEIMRTIPAAVPISMNAAGDYWRMIVNAARRVAGYALKGAPYAGAALSAIGAATGNPFFTLGGQALSTVARKSGAPKKAPAKKK